MNNGKIPKNPQKFNCELCYYSTSNKKDFNKHLATDKHSKITNDKESYPKIPKIPKIYSCACGKIYKYVSGLSAHKKKCKPESNPEPKPDIIIEEKVDISFKEMFLEMVNQNKELQKTIIEQTKTIQEMVPKIGNNNISNNKVVNNTVVNNLTLLNTNCKDALTLNAFIDSIEVGIKDLVYTSEKGLADGITNLFLEHYNKLPLELKPVWCVDKKRKKMYIKEDEWEEDIANQKTKAAIINLTAKQARSSGKYTQENPDWMQYDEKKDQFVHIVRHTTQDMDEIKQTHIISNLLDKIHLTNAIKSELKTVSPSTEEI